MKISPTTVFKSFIFFTLFIASVVAKGQYNRTANEFVPTYNNYFTFGTNNGYPSNGKWSSEALGNLGAGNESLSIPGAGCNSLRGSLPEHFLEKWGYNIRIDAYQHFANLGMFDLTVFIGYPSDAHKDNTSYCSKGSSKLFANMYEPIWDDNNGTPINENNYLANYVYKMVNNYGNRVKFWEIWNEPDYNSTNIGWKDETYSDNWYIRDPKPEELDNLLAPIYHYVRALRICYEVIKSIDENDFVCIGGIGYSSFLDAILRSTDNPSGGSVSTNYPAKGGAYFDCVSYHNYPMYSLRKWENGAWTYSRHSDKAVEVVINGKSKHKEVLTKYGYDGGTYPKKEFIITETNVPTIAIDEYIGSLEAQRNFLMKLIVEAQKADIKSVHTYSLYDGRAVGSETTPYHSMGFYNCLNNVVPYNQQEKISALGCRSAMKVLANMKYSQTKTDALNLSADIGGAAFEDAFGTTVYALWTKTTTDKNETVGGQYTFPTSLNVSTCNKYDWQFANSGQPTVIASSMVQLDATPAFFTINGTEVGFKELAVLNIAKIYPNPVKDNLFIEIKNSKKVSRISLQNIEGKELLKIKDKKSAISINMSKYKPGIYFVEFNHNNKIYKHKIVKY